MLFPLYKREYLKLGNQAGSASKTIEIRNFDLWTPTKTQCLFSDTFLQIENNKRCAVYGVNGSGKTMLFHAIATGEVAGFPAHVSTHHMQEMSMDPEADTVSVMDTVISSHPMRRVLCCMEPHLEKLVSEEKDEDRRKGLEANLKYVKAEMTAIDAYTAVERASTMLRVLGFDEKGEAAPMSSLSGGLRMRVALTAAFFIDPDLLLLDEPTNHLDLPSVLWLENKLRGYKGSFLLVTHDRHILENVVTSCMHIEDQKIIPYSMGFAKFEQVREDKAQAREGQIERFLKVNRGCIDPSSPQASLKATYQAWTAKRNARKIAMSTKFKFKAPTPLPCPAGMLPEEISLIRLEDMTFSYDAATLPFIFKTPLNYEIKQGTRVGIMGPNGAGKSTILKLITGKLTATTGKIVTNPDFTLAYFGQHSTKELNMDETPIEFMEGQFPKANKGDLISHLEKTSILRDVQEKRMSGLSFSQRSCIIFAKLTFVPPHLLIMDEPTNFLDLESVDSLISAANAFKGALITVTHNRDFLKRCSKHFLSITPGAFIEFDSMKDAERATYSFIGALERGEDVDHKTAIQENRGGGAIHTPEYLAKKAAERKALLDAQEKRRAAAEKAEAEAAAVLKLKEEKEAAKKAAIKTDWEAGDDAWAAVPGAKGSTWTLCKIVRVMKATGDATVELPTGGKKMIPIKKLKTSNPEGGKAVARPASAQGGGRGGGGRGAKSGNARGRGGGGGGRGGAQTAGRGGGARGRGGGRGGGRGARVAGQRKSSAGAA